MNMHYRKLDNVTINFGPQHPAAHGVLRLLIEMSGENIGNIDAHIGLLHRGTEKLLESKMVLQGLPYFDRLDYVPAMSQEHTYSLAVENFFDIKVPLRAQVIRVLFLELTRILNHILAITTHALDVGALTPFLWGFEEREEIMRFYESVSGARLHAAYIRPGGVSENISINLLEDISHFLRRCKSRILELHQLLSSNRIWKERLIGIGIISLSDALNAGFSGVMLRGCGLHHDIRKFRPYEIYGLTDFNIMIGSNGDCYDRYLIRIGEISSSLEIASQCLLILQKFNTMGNFKISDYKFTLPEKAQMHQTMEQLIHHFKVSSSGFTLDNKALYTSTETPKGEFGVYLVGNNNSKIYRCRIRAPGFFHLQGLNLMAQNLMLADLVTIIGTQDIVFGEIDR